MGRLYPDDLLCGLSLLWIKNAILGLEDGKASFLLDYWMFVSKAASPCLPLTSSRAMLEISRGISMGSLRDSEGSLEVDNCFCALYGDDIMYWVSILSIFIAYKA